MHESKNYFNFETLLEFHDSISTWIHFVSLNLDSEDNEFSETRFQCSIQVHQAHVLIMRRMRKLCDQTSVNGEMKWLKMKLMTDSKRISKTKRRYNDHLR